MGTTRHFRGRTWTPAERKRVLNLVAEGVSYREIARRYHVSTNTISGLVFRQRHGLKYKAEQLPSERRKYEAVHAVRNHQPAKAPYAPDSSCPDFAWDDQHCEAVRGARPDGYPVMPVRL